MNHLQSLAQRKTPSGGPVRCIVIAHSTAVLDAAYEFLATHREPVIKVDAAGNTFGRGAAYLPRPTSLLHPSSPNFPNPSKVSQESANSSTDRPSQCSDDDDDDDDDHSDDDELSPDEPTPPCVDSNSVGGAAGHGRRRSTTLRQRQKWRRRHVAPTLLLHADAPVTNLSLFAGCFDHILFLERTAPAAKDAHHLLFKIPYLRALMLQRASTRLRQSLELANESATTKSTIGRIVRSFSLHAVCHAAFLHASVCAEQACYSMYLSDDIAPKQDSKQASQPRDLPRENTDVFAYDQFVKQWAQPGPRRDRKSQNDHEAPQPVLRANALLQMPPSYFAHDVPAKNQARLPGTDGALRQKLFLAMLSTYVPRSAVGPIPVSRPMVSAASTCDNTTISHRAQYAHSPHVNTQHVKSQSSTAHVATSEERKYATRPRQFPWVRRAARADSGLVGVDKKALFYNGYLRHSQFDTSLPEKVVAPRVEPLKASFGVPANPVFGTPAEKLIVPESASRSALTSGVSSSTKNPQVLCAADLSNVPLCKRMRVASSQAIYASCSASANLVQKLPLVYGPPAVLLADDVPWVLPSALVINDVGQARTEHPATAPRRLTRDEKHRVLLQRLYGLQQPAADSVAASLAVSLHAGPNSQACAFALPPCGIVVARQHNPVGIPSQSGRTLRDQMQTRKDAFETGQPLLPPPSASATIATPASDDVKSKSKAKPSRGAFVIAHSTPSKSSRGNSASQSSALRSKYFDKVSHAARKYVLRVQFSTSISTSHQLKGDVERSYTFSSPEAVARFFLIVRPPPTDGTDATASTSSSKSSKSGSSSKASRTATKNSKSSAAREVLWTTPNDPPLKYPQPSWQPWEDDMLVFGYILHGPNHALLAQTLSNW